MKHIKIINIDKLNNVKSDFLELKINFERNKLDVSSIIDGMIKDLNYDYSFNSFMVIVDGDIHKCKKDTVDSLINNEHIKNIESVEIIADILN